MYILLDLLTEAWFFTMNEACLSRDISVWKITPRFFAESQGDITLESRLIVFTGGFILLGLNSRHSVLLGLTDDLFDIIHENTSLIQDSIVERANEVSSGENDK